MTSTRIEASRQKEKFHAVMVDLSAQQQIEGYEKPKAISPREISEGKQS